MLASLLGWSLVAGVGALVARVMLSRWELILPDGSREVEESTGHEVAKWGGRAAVSAIAVLGFWGGATVVSLGGGAKAGGSGSATPSAPVVSAVAAVVVDTSTTRVTYIVTAAGGSAHDSSRVRIRRLGGTVLIDSIFGGAVLDKTVASNDSLKADTTYVAGVMARATNGAGWSAEVFDTLVNTASAWPNNEPSGMTLIASTDGSDKYFGTGGSIWFFDGVWSNNDSVQGDLTSSGSRYGTVIRKRVKAGYGSEWHGIAACNGCSTWSTAYKEVYFRWIVKYSANYDVHSSGEKHFYWGNGGTGSANDFYILMEADREIGIHNQVANAGFTQVLSGDVMTLGEWHAFEMRIRHESVISANDGVITIWMDGDTIYNNVAVNWRTTGDTNFRGLQVYGYWGGAGDTKAVTDSIDISEFYVSGKN